MKKLCLTATVLLSMVTGAFAQEGSEVKNKEITARNSWLKLGLTAGMPVGNASKASSFTAGLDLRGQFMSTRHFGLGVVTGYNHYFGKNNAADFGAIPLALMLRYYPKAKGIFAGADLGYSFVTNITGLTGGVTVKPQVGYHNHDWNFFGFYNHIFTKSAVMDIQSVGVSATYNIRFK